MASNKGRRGLSAEERALWSKVIEGTIPLPKPPPRATTFSPPEDKRAKTIPQAAIKEPFRIGEKAAKGKTVAQALKSTVARPPRMDAKAFARMRRGRLKPEARLDLHGLTASAAHAALISFVLRAQNEGKRLVLVITGKGRDRDISAPLSDAPGILRRQVPHWLETPPLFGAVLQVEAAHQRHGGSGAYYVYLRRRQ